jgi:hypothetical protein
MARTGRPKENGRTTQLVRIPVGWDKQEMIDLYILIQGHLDIHLRNSVEGGNKTRNWTEYNRLMEEIKYVLKN